MTTAFKIDVFNASTGEFDRDSVSVIRTHTIGFVRCGRSDNFIVTFCNPAYPPRTGPYRQQIVVLPGAFHRIIPDVSRHAIAGTTEATLDQLAALGFILKKGGYSYARTSIAN